MKADIKTLQETIANAFLDTKPGKRHWALMLFNTEMELGISNKPNKWVNTGNRYFSNGQQALDAYANTPNPASQLVDGESPEELLKEMEDMLAHYDDEKWLEENLYPYL